MANLGSIPLNVKYKWSAGVTSAILVAGLAGSVLSQAQDDDWVLPRTEYGHPDLQGNWTNATMTPVQRPDGMDKVLTPEQIATIEGKREALIQSDAAPSDPNRGAPAVGGVLTGDPIFDGATGGTGGYNYFYIDAGDRVAY